LATPNYGYEKRQRELAKRQKKEEKLRAKSARRHNPDGSPVDDGDAPDAAAGGAEERPAGSTPD